MHRFLRPDFSRRSVAAIAAAVVGAAALAGCGSGGPVEADPGPTSSEQASPSPTTASAEQIQLEANAHAAHIETTILDKDKVDIDSMKALAATVYSPVQAAIDKKTPADKLPKPASVGASLNNLYKTDFNLSAVHTAKDAAQRLIDSTAFIDITPDVDAADMPYLPEGTIVVESGAPGSYFLTVSLRSDNPAAVKSRSVLANSFGMEDIQKQIDKGTLTYVLAPVKPTIPLPPSETPTPTPSVSPTPTTSPTPKASTPGNPPVQPIAISHGSRAKKEIALTFDADMMPNMLALLKSGKATTWYNKKVIDELEQENVPATLFMTGLWVQTYPDIAKQLAENPLFQIGNHSYNHYSYVPSDKCYGLKSMPDSQDATDIKKAQDAIITATGVTPTVFRFAGLCHDDFDLAQVAAEGMVTIDGTASGDPGNHNTQSIVDNVIKNTRNGSIVVMHMHGDGGFDKGFAPKSAEALAKIIPLLRGEGYKFVQVSQLMADARKG
jgi:peptidoglycan/xylan/chitin deacetylase (PgdA/CDA1 family)